MINTKRVTSLFLGIALTLGLGFSFSSLKRESSVLAAGEVVDNMATALFVNAPKSYTKDGTEYGSTGTSSSVSYQATGINLAKAVRGNQIDWYANFCLRNTTTFEGYYVSQITLTVSGGTIDGSTSGRSELFVSSTMFAKGEAPSGSAITPSPASPSQTTLTWTNADKSASFFQLYSLKTSLTATCVTLDITWSPKEVLGPSISINETNKELHIGDDFTFTVGMNNIPEPLPSVTWTVKEQDGVTDTTKATITNSGVFTALEPGQVKVIASVDYESNTYTSSVDVKILFSEPTIEEKTLSELIALEYNQSHAYRSTAVIKSWKNGGASPDKYGNLVLCDDEGNNDLIVYGTSATESIISYNENTGLYSLTNPQDFLTNSETNRLSIGDRISFIAVRCDYLETKEVTILLTNMANSPIVDTFVNTYMHPEIANTNHDDTGACRGESGYYALAKTAFNGLTELQREEFTTSETYVQARTRLEAWATANGEVLNNASFVLGSNNTIAFNSSNDGITIVIICTSLTLSSLLAFVLIKKKHNR